MSKERAIFAGGCFWCMVQPFEEQTGILAVTSGYTGGHVDNPTYEQVCNHQTGHTEAVEIIFDNEKITYKDLVELYWEQTDPTDMFGQFEDRGDNYRPVIFYTADSQREVAEKSKEALRLFSLIISTIICGLFMPLTFNLMMTHIERNTVSPAVGFSMWWVYASVFLGALGMMVYYVVNVCKSIRRLRTL